MIKNTTSVLAVCLLLTMAAAFKVKQTAPYDKNKSKIYAYYAGLSYCPTSCLTAWNCKDGQSLTNFGEVTTFSNKLTLTQGFIGYDKALNLIIVSFRGSHNTENWIEDFTFEKVSYSCKGCEIHLGFY
jgi:hypothetical protein